MANSRPRYYYLRRISITIVSVLGLLALLAGTVQVTTWGLEPNYCAMTFMFPNFVLVSEVHESRRRGICDKYGLYLYLEGYGWRNPEEKLRELTGVPVLFIPGNAGSHRQVRSLGAESHNIYTQFASSFPNHLDVFAVDFEEELSALSGDLLKQHSWYVNHCVARILELYTQNTALSLQPQSVILVGHSMGGLVARSVYNMENYVENSVSTILSLSTPQNNPVVLASRSTFSFYDSINRHWSKYLSPEHIKGGPLSQVTIVSIGGGFRDILVRSSLSDLETIGVPTSHGLTTLSTSIPDVWRQTDHTCMVWCNQVVKKIVWTLLDVVDKNTRQATLPREDRMTVFRNHLISTLPAYLGLNHETARQSVPLGSKSTATNVLKKKPMREILISLRRQKVTETFLFDVPQRLYSNVNLSLTGDSGEDTFQMFAAVVEQYHTLKVFVVLSGTSQLQVIEPVRIASFTHGVSNFIVQINRDVLSNCSHVVIKIESGQNTVYDLDVFLAGKFVDARNHQSLSVSLFGGPEYFQLPEGSLFSLFSFPQHSKILPITVNVEASPSTSEVEHTLLSYQYTSSMKEEIFRPDTKFDLRFHSLPRLPSASNQDVQLILWTNPSRRYEVRFEIQLVSVLGQLFHWYGASVLALSFVVFFMHMAGQMLHFSRKIKFPSLLDVILTQYVTPNLLVLLSLIFLHLLHGVLPEFITQWTDYLLFGPLLESPAAWVICVLYASALGYHLLLVVISTILCKSSQFLFGPFGPKIIAVVSHPMVFIVLLLGGVVSHGSIMVAFSFLIAVLTPAPTPQSSNYKTTLVVFQMITVASVGSSLIIWLKNVPWWSLFDFTFDLYTICGIASLLHTYTYVLRLRSGGEFSSSAGADVTSVVIMGAAIVLAFTGLFAIFVAIETFAVVHVVFTAFNFGHTRQRKDRIE
ncbi:hypothetical protein PROFUN_03544 [Planoprotostelium fungivorum]|uniref:GPI inositol-deacylase n=1 Tax=Planoprotostelium fungivorum TaxID=1890364 RepID=A0A2P6MSD7_9EUKA|nr:hypothetical protein PROFUN_03544 [Planoprotostelium fungivorum]